MMALRGKNFVAARGALGVEALPSPPGWRCKVDEVFCALFVKKAPLAC
jgi:hypothetical protein